MRWILRVAFGALGMIGIIFIVGFFLPDKLFVERSIVVNAPQDRVFSLVADFRNWPEWSPWAEMDPDAVFTFSGRGVGQTMHWESEDPAVGVGYNTIGSLRPNNEMTFHIELGKDGRGFGRFVLQPTDKGINVVWSVAAKLRDGQPWYRKPLMTYMQYAIDLDQAIGGEYETGLRNLKSVAEADLQ